MIQFTIAIGKSRRDLRWKNKQFTWDELLKRISKTHRTVETVSEYLELKKERQDEIKDVGGFVGGYLSGGRRLASAITSRQLLTFDADEATPDFWDKFTLNYGCAAAIYSTHKHTPTHPRLRLLIPLKREVLPDEYSAIIRRIAGDIGIDMFDHTGFQHHRLMYWPSTSVDGEYVFQVQDGPVLDPDEVLSTYRNWQDMAEWPQGSKEKKTLKDAAKKQGDPYEKPGLIGAFNRAYPISEVIKKYIPDIYAPSSIPGRYTYLEGSTASGVIIYEDKFLYSHHSTDPVSNILCNAFDLIRLHKFGLKDSEKDDTPINKRPSFLAMCDLVSSDPKVKKQLGEAKLEAAKIIFEEVEAEEVPEDLNWLEDMDVDRKGNYLFTIHNISLILEKDPVFSNNIAYDEFEQQPIFRRDLPWRKVGKQRGMTDNDLANIENYIEKVYKLSCGGKLQKGLSVVFEKFKFHPVVDYLRKVRWDGQPRVDKVLVDYLGCEDSNYVRTVTRKTLVAAVARVHEPGIKFDTILTTIGDEGQGKSTLWDKLGGRWFSDTFNFHMLQTKEGYEQIQGVWIVEVGELSGMAKVEVEKVKNFVAARKDRYRSPWGKMPEVRQRQNIFVAGSNKRDPLKSQNGNRRFWPVSTYEQAPRKDIYKITQEEIDQIWAEAVNLYDEGETLYLNTEQNRLALREQEKYTEENPWVEIFKEYLSRKIPKNWYNISKYDKIDIMVNYTEGEDCEERDRVCKYELWEIALMKKETLDTYGLSQIKQAMAKIKDWTLEDEYVRFGTSYPRHRGSYRKIIKLESIL